MGKGINIKNTTPRSLAMGDEIIVSGGDVNKVGISTAGNELRIHTIATQGVDGNLANLVLGQLRNKVSLVTIVSHADCNVSLTTTRNDAE